MNAVVRSLYGPPAFWTEDMLKHVRLRPEEWQWDPFGADVTIFSRDSFGPRARAGYRM